MHFDVEETCIFFKNLFVRQIVGVMLSSILVHPLCLVHRYVYGLKLLESEVAGMMYNGFIQSQTGVVLD